MRGSDLPLWMEQFENWVEILKMSEKANFKQSDEDTCIAFMENLDGRFSTSVQIARNDPNLSESWPKLKQYFLNMYEHLKPKIPEACVNKSKSAKDKDGGDKKEKNKKNNKDKNEPNRTIKCYNCGEKGHKSVDCKRDPAECEHCRKKYNIEEFGKSKKRDKLNQGVDSSDDKMNPKMFMLKVDNAQKMDMVLENEGSDTDNSKRNKVFVLYPYFKNM